MIQQLLERHCARLIGVAVLVAVVGEPTNAGVVWYLNDYEGWAAAAGEVFEINFNTMPDGNPSIVGTPITPDFNYTSQGVTFSGPVNFPFIVGNSTTGFAIDVDSSPSIQRNWIIGEQVVPANALGFGYPSSAIISIFDEEGQLIASKDYGVFGSSFLGALSDVPIASFTVDRNSSFAVLGTYYRGTIPEPSVLMLCGAGVFMLKARLRHAFCGSREME